jgi:hypothetical protein
MPPMPTKPQLTPTASSDGGVCFDRQDSAELGIYILDLERGYRL